MTSNAISLRPVSSGEGPPLYPPPLSGIDIARRRFPAPTFAVDGFVLKGYVNLLYGHGGSGKTLLGLHFAVAVAAGIPIFGLQTQQMPVLVVLMEDGEGETQSRLLAICAELDVDLAALPIKIWCLQGHDATLARIQDDGEFELGPFHPALAAELASMPAPMVILDTVSDIATLDENRRLPVNTLCKIVLGSLCREFGATVLVNAHPSKAAMNDGANYAGSTAWNNAVRVRLSLTTAPNSSKRILVVEKANYSHLQKIELRLSGKTLARWGDSGPSPSEERHLVYEFVAKLVTAGIDVVRVTGNGQKPRDIAAGLKDLHGLDISAQSVSAHLAALERDGRLRYRSGGNHTRGLRAGFSLPDGTV